MVTSLPGSPTAPDPGAERVLSQILLFLFAVFAIQSVHHFFAYVDHYPYWSVDDGLSVISASLLQVGRYGDPAVPLEPFSAAQRYRGFYNYGPWYFFAGAGIVWLFGFSVKVLRSLHLLAALAVPLVAGRLFTGLRGAIATTVAGVGVCYAVSQLEWPMVRPDPFVTLFAALAIWAAAKAIMTGLARHWFTTGLAAGCGALSHLVAATLIPASLTMLAVSVLCLSRSRGTGPERGAITGWVAALLAGWCTSAVIFYASFGFRVRDHLRLILSYRSIVRPTTTSALGTASPLAVWKEHYRFASAGVDGIYVVAVALTLILAIALIAIALAKPGSARVETAALIVPGVTVFVFYVAGLALYQNFHTGYVILPQLIGVWIGAATLYVVLGAVRRRLPRRGRAIECVAAIAVALFVARLNVTVATAADDARVRIARSWIGITPYIDEVLGTVPRQSIAWGSYALAAEGPRRIQLVSMETALRIMSRVPVDQRASLAPDFLVWGHPQNTDAIVFPFTDPAKDPVRLIGSLLPAVEFSVAAMTSATPYGTTRIYARRTADDAAERIPLVSVWDAPLGRWLRQVMPLPGIAWSRARGGLRVSKGSQAWNSVATDTAVADLVAGWYLFRVAPPPQSGMRQLLVAGRGIAHEFAVGDLPPPIDVAVRLRREPVYLLQHHDGGLLAVNLFSDAADARLGTIDAFRVTGVDDYRLARERAAEHPLPPLSTWVATASDGVTAARDGAGLVVSGNASASGYQLVSARVDVRPEAEAIVRLPLTIQAGRVCTGVLDEGQRQWLVAPSDAMPVHRFSAGANRSVFVVVANCNGAGAAASRFTVAAGGVAIVRELGYAEELMRAW
ncbi:MAG: hypothetical protein JWL71_4114 [Acidobacteria bacterium]|nr:hypothetical protein [Acidobacteriota bacterium]